MDDSIQETWKKETINDTTMEVRVGGIIVIRGGETHFSIRMP